MSVGHTHRDSGHRHAHSDLSETAPEAWRELLREKGLRVTPARVLVLAVLEVHGHGTPEHVHEHAEQSAPGISLSTIYRTLETLAEHEVVSHTHLLGSSATYMLASHADHGHLVCRGCNGVFQLDDVITHELAASVSGKYGFELDEGHLSIFGRCANCSG